MINIFMFGNDSNETFNRLRNKNSWTGERNFEEFKFERKSFLIASNFDLTDFMRKLQLLRKALHLKVY